MQPIQHQGSEYPLAALNTPEGNWAGFWGNEAIDQKLHDIGTSGPVVLEPDYSKLKVVGLTPDVARILRADEYHGLICGAGRNAQAVSDDYKLDKSREGLEGRVRDHPADTSGTRRQGLGSPRCLRRARKCIRMIFASVMLLASPLNAESLPASSARTACSSWAPGSQRARQSRARHDQDRQRAVDAGQVGRGTSPTPQWCGQS